MTGELQSPFFLPFVVSQEEQHKDDNDDAILLEALLKKYDDEGGNVPFSSSSSSSFLDGTTDGLPVQAACHSCDEVTCWHCPQCQHYVCSMCASWEDELVGEGDPDPLYDTDDDEVIIRRCDECDCRLEMMVR